jgi:ATP synthase protein I
MDNRDTKNNSGISAYAKFSGIVFEMLVIIGGGTFFGNWLDEKKGKDFPLFTLIFSLISVGIALYIVIRQVIQFSKDNEKD